MYNNDQVIYATSQKINTFKNKLVTSDWLKLVTKHTRPKSGFDIREEAGGVNFLSLRTKLRVQLFYTYTLLFYYF